MIDSDHQRVEAIFLWAHLALDEMWRDMFEN